MVTVLILLALLAVAPAAEAQRMQSASGAVLAPPSGSAAEAQPGLAPQSLIGEWRGKWSSGAATGGPGPRSGRDGPFVLTITGVDGDAVRGTFEMLGATTRFRGTLQANRLRFGNEQFQTELIVDGDSMHGTRQRAGAPLVILELSKSTRPPAPR